MRNTRNMKLNGHNNFDALSSKGSLTGSFTSLICILGSSKNDIPKTKLTDSVRIIMNANTDARRLRLLPAFNGFQTSNSTELPNLTLEPTLFNKPPRSRFLSSQAGITNNQQIQQRSVHQTEPSAEEFHFIKFSTDFLSGNDHLNQEKMIT